MQFEFTHRFDTRRTGGRLKNVKKFWYIITEHFLKKGAKLRVRYYQGDIRIKDDLSTAFGIVELEKYTIMRHKTSENTIEIICPLNLEVSNLVLGENPYDDAICPWWDFQILDNNGKTIFASHDWGSDTLMVLTQEDIENLIERGLDTSYLITPVFIPNDVTRIINGVPQPD